MNENNKKKKKVLLINQSEVPHYRINVYNYLSRRLHEEGYDLTIISEPFQIKNDRNVKFNHIEIVMNAVSLIKNIKNIKPSAVIYWVNLKHLYLFPVLFYIKMKNIKAIYWGHGTDLAKKGPVKIKYMFNKIEHMISDAIILYADKLKENVSNKLLHKTFVANNTLHFDIDKRCIIDKKECLEKFGIETQKNVICVGRMQKRKRLENLYEAYTLLKKEDVGLIFVGPDNDGILEKFEGEHVYIIGELYDEDLISLMSSSDVFCLPGAVGLSIVDAFYCGLPLITECGDDSPELMYLRDGINGFIVPRNDIGQLKAKLYLLLSDSKLRKQFSENAKKEITTNGSMEKMCQGFLQALNYVFR